MANEQSIQEFRQAMSAASYYLAAEGTSEWRHGYTRIDDAARIARREGWTEDDIREIVSGRSYLVSVSDIVRKL